MRDKLARYESLADPEAMWKAVQKKQEAEQEKPGKKYPFLWILILIGITAIGGSLYTYMNDNSNNYRGEILSAENQVQSPEKLTNAGESDLKITEINISDESIKKNNTDNIDQILDAPIQNSENERTGFGETSFATADASSSNERKIKTGSKPTVQNSKEIKNNTQNNQNSGDEFRVNLSGKNKIETSISKIANDRAENNNIPMPNEASKSGFYISNLPILSLKPNMVVSQKFNLTLPVIEKSESVHFIQKNNNLSFSAGVQFAYQYTFRKMDGLSGYPGDHIADRIGSENSLDAYRISLFGQMAYKNTYIETGISFAQITDKLSLSTSTDKVIFIDTITQLLIYKDSSTSSVQGMLEGIERITTLQTRYNRYKTFDIPVFIGYQQHIGQSKWSYYLSGGVLINIRFSQSGYILSPENGNLVSAASLSADKYWNKFLGLNLAGTCGLSYQWDSGFAFQIGPQFEFGTRSLTGNSSGIKQEYNRLGFQSRITFKF